MNWPVQAVTAANPRCNCFPSLFCFFFTFPLFRRKLRFGACAGVFLLEIRKELCYDGAKKPYFPVGKEMGRKHDKI